MVPKMKLLKYFIFSVGSTRAFGSKAKSKSFKISAFKGSARDESSSGRTNGSFVKNPTKEVFLHQKSEEACSESSMVQNAVPTPYSASDETTTRSRAIQALFRKWLILLRTPSESQPIESTVEQSSSVATHEMPKDIEKQKHDQLLKTIWCSFMGLDAAIRIPLVLFPSAYSAINLFYGSEVSRELAPLWVIGPLVMAVYIKACQIIVSLYARIFRETIKIFKNFPNYCLLIHQYLFGGKLKEAMQKHLWQPIVDIKNMDYKKATVEKMKVLLEWLLDKYLDFVKAIWPYYCRTIRFLKRANLL